ncbi:TDT family transporter [Arthrobacter sp. FW306-2-2C-D06B]|uniref:SLAC1 family transporter n=1 Tax=Arthrobacter sp. FW306-2-2C-D06B TaxID=2879618 RepID=UPI001F20D6D4|nr:TDT family transporter [Arthrobacter sp. FW306-2-2C-D06B]UKA60572.1 TDT family transporter [Arthrobacter sp. FW306-2-2C-D06B]
MTDTGTAVALTPAPTDRVLSRATLSGIPALSRFGIPLGLAGLGGGWSAARSSLGSPMWPEEILYGASGSLWLILSAVYVVRGLRRKGTFRADLRHEVAGPFASFIPLIGILLSSHYSQYLPPWGAWPCVAFIAGLAVVAAQLLAHWVTGGVSMQSIHPGYLLPVAAGSFVASIGFSSIHAHSAAMAAFGVGVFFWLVMGTVVTVRLMTGGEVLPAAKVGLSAYLAAPATANIAWMVSHPGPMGAIQLGLTGILLIMVLMQVMLLPEYRKLPFTQMFWVFTFPVGATTNYAIRWLATTDLPGREIYAWAILGLATAFTLVIAARTVPTPIAPKAARLAAPRSTEVH